MSRQSGFVLVNALVIVAAMAAASVYLLTRAEGGRARLEASQTAGQLTYYLDAFDALAITVLGRDQNGPSVDHLGEDWANSDYAVPLDRGAVAGQITDLQGLFNLNWLTSSAYGAAPDAFSALLRRVGVSAQSGEAIIAFMQPGGPEVTRGFAALDPSVRPVGGALLFFDQISDIPSLSARDIDRLRPVVTALPVTSPVNLNTASLELLATLMPEIPGGLLNQILRTREQEPFASVETFLDQIEQRMGEPLSSDFDASRLSVASEWFQVQSVAQLQGQQARRTSMVQRLGRQSPLLTRYRISVFE